MTARMTPDEQHGLSVLFQRLSRGEDVSQLLTKTPLVSLRAKVRRAEQVEAERRWQREQRQHRWLAEHDDRSVKHRMRVLPEGALSLTKERVSE